MIANADEIAASLRADTNALGVWLLGRTRILNNEPRPEVLAAAVSDPSVRAPRLVDVDGEAYFDFEDRQVFAERFGNVQLLVIFDVRSSHGLVRLRVRNAKPAIRALAASI